MRQTVVTVEALRCHECQAFIDPVEGAYVRRQIRTAVEVGHRYGPIERYELANVCVACDDALTEQWKAAALDSAQCVQTVGLLFIALIVGGLLHYIGWPVPIAIVVTAGLLWYGILGRSLVGMFVTGKILETSMGTAMALAWATPMTIVVIAVMLATKYGRHVFPQRNLPAEV